VLDETKLGHNDMRAEAEAQSSQVGPYESHDDHI
jgi:hypothetical protein